MARTRGANKKAVTDSAEDCDTNAFTAQENPTEDDPMMAEKPVRQHKRTKSRRGRMAGEKDQEPEEQNEVNRNSTTAELEEQGDTEAQAPEELGGRTSRSVSRLGKGWGKKDKEQPKEAQLVSFPSIMDESINTTGTTVPFPEPYIPKPMYTPVIPATPKRAMPNVPPKTPKFDPDLHGKDLDEDPQEENGFDTFTKLMKRSPQKKTVENKNLEIPPPLELDAVQVAHIQLPEQTEEEMEILSETPGLVGRQTRRDDQLQSAEPIAEAKALESVPLDLSKGRVTRKTAPTAVVTPLSVRKTRAGASVPPVAVPATATTTRRVKQPETVKTTSPPASPPKASQRKAAPASPPRAETKKTTHSTPSKAPASKTTPTTPPRTTRSKRTSPPATTVGPTAVSPPGGEMKQSATTTPPRADAVKPAPVTPSRSPVKKTTPNVSPRSNAGKLEPSTPPKSISKSTTPRQTTPRAAANKAAQATSLQSDPKKSSPTSLPREIAKKPTARAVAKPSVKKPSVAASARAPIREKKPVADPKAPVKEILPIRMKRVASGPVPPTKRIRPTPPIAGGDAEGSQGQRVAAAPAPRPRIASLSAKPSLPAKSSKPPTKPTGFRLLGQDVAKKQAEAKEARKKRMEEADAAKALLKEQDGKGKKPIHSKTSSVASKASRESNVTAAVNGQLEREAASAEGKEISKSSKSKVPSSPPRPSQARPIKPPTIVPRPALVIHKKAPTTKLTTTSSKATPGPVSGAASKTEKLTPEQEEALRKERAAQVDVARKNAADRGRAAVLAWAAQEKNKLPTAVPTATPTTIPSATSN